MYYYNFPAVKGVQANSEYYICMIPCGLLSKIFIFESEDILPEYRAQRKLNQLRIPEMKNYILNNRDTYVFSALAASIDGIFEFNEIDNSNLGTLNIDMNAKFLINDGQHRKKAIEEAIREDETLINETIPVVFFKDKGLARSQQMFTDLNKHAVNTSKSLNTLYDSSNEIAVMTKQVVEKIEFFKLYTDKENDTLGKFSQKLFTLNNFYNANQKMLMGIDLNEEVKKFIFNYWDLLSKSIYEWNQLDTKEITKRSLREDYIITQGVVLLAFGKLGNYFIKNKKYSFDKYLPKLMKINWARNCDKWKNRTIVNGKISRKEENINLTYIQIKRELNLPITDKELDSEKKIIKDR